MSRDVIWSHAWESPSPAVSRCTSVHSLEDGSLTRAGSWQLQAGLDTSLSGQQGPATDAGNTSTGLAIDVSAFLDAPRGRWRSWRIDARDLALHYRLADTVFSGGGGVFKGDWRGTPVAIKLICLDWVGAWLEGVDIMTRLRHPNVLQLLGLAVMQHMGVSHLAVVTDLVPQGDLERVMRRGGRPLGPGELLGIAKDVAAACAYLHAQAPPVLHRDINTRSVLLVGTDPVRAKLSSFGISQLKTARHHAHAQGEYGSSSLGALPGLDLGMLRGQPQFLVTRYGSIGMQPPELFCGGGGACHGEGQEGDASDANGGGACWSEAGDVYAFGFLLFEMVTGGRRPFEGEGPAAGSGSSVFDALMRVVRHGERPGLPPDVDPAAAALIARCWAQDPRQRPRFDEVLVELGRMDGLCLMAGEMQLLEGGEEEEEKGEEKREEEEEPLPLPPDYLIDPLQLEVRECLGAGAFGAVHRGRWLGTPVAVKLQGGPQQPMDEQQLEQCRREALLMCGLHHPNVVQLLGAARLACRQVAIVMELVSHGREPSASLFSLLRSPRVSFTPERRLGVAQDVAKGMAYLHAKCPPILHRDLKSLNVLVTKTWRAKLCDFGMSRAKLASALDGGTGRPSTLRWMAPEYVAGAACIERSDVYSFGCVLYELATGRMPWQDQEVDAQVLFKVLVEGQVLSPPQGVDPQLAALMRRCCAHDPAARPTFPQVLDELAAMREIRPVAAAGACVSTGGGGGAGAGAGAVVDGGAGAGIGEGADAGTGAADSARALALGGPSAPSAAAVLPVQAAAPGPAASLQPASAAVGVLAAQLCEWELVEG